ncbi:MAG: hypothetical protein IJA36_08490 [Lachnospiraceae bacterium]|nr:hypothetical protein [Lachnospiraceae bacterium]
MKDILEEYGVIIISVTSMGALVGFIIKIRELYRILGEGFLNMIGG